mgnify:FL=1
MEGFKTYSGYKVGASHIAKNMGCEDYAATYDDEKVCIAVISDGHGDKKCFRSAQGAHIACDVSIGCVRKLIESSPSSCDVIRKSPDRIITELERTIIREWNNGVNNDLSLNPITEGEMNGLPEDAVEAIRSVQSLNKIYGCTLIMCVVLDGFWFGIHIGDGKCVVAMKNGLYTQPIPWDEVGCVGNRSTSICNSNSFAGFRYIYGTDIPTGLFVASDGIDESFDESGLNRCYYTLGYWVQTLSKEELDSKIDELLTQVTNNGSGDDVSIACILSTANDIKKPYASSEQVAEKLKELIDNIKDKETQYDSLVESKREASESLAEHKAEIEDLKKKIALLEEQVKDKEQELTNIDNNLHEVALQLQKSVAQLPKAKETKERIDQYWKGNGVEIKEDTELDYSPRYSEEQLENIITEIEGLHKDEQLAEEINNQPEITATTGNIDEPTNEENDAKEDNDQAIVVQAEPTERTDVSATIFPPVEPTSNIGIESYRKIAEKNAPPNPEADSKGQKNGFFGGLFGRKK